LDLVAVFEEAECLGLFWRQEEAADGSGGGGRGAPGRGPPRSHAQHFVEALGDAFETAQVQRTFVLLFGQFTTEENYVEFNLFLKQCIQD